jgi:hypothetical protein
VITIPTGDLVGILADVIPFAWQDDDLPMLNIVKLEWDGRQLHALATDRFRVGISTWEPGDIGPGEEAQDDLFTDFGSGDEPWAMTIGLDQAKELVKVFKLPPKESSVPLAFDYDAERWQAKVSRSKDTGYSGLSVLAADLREPFPDVRQLIAKAKVKSAGTIAYTAKLLADFAKVRPRGPLVLTFGGNEGVTLVQIGKRFAGAIMPARVELLPE